MRSKMTQMMVALVLVMGWSGVASADVTITGTVGEIGIMPYTAFGNQGGAGTFTFIRFKLTDATQTATCADQTSNKNGGTTKYAYFYGTNGNIQSNPGDTWYKEWYAALLVSKKGATITCTVLDNMNCRVTSCTLN